MMKMKVTCIYQEDDPFLSGIHFDNTTYDFLVTAMNNNPDIDYNTVPIRSEYDATRLKGKTDAIILVNIRDYNMPKIHGLKDLNIPILARCGDFHDAPRYGTGEQNYHDYGVDCMFNFMSEKYFYKYYPKSMNYRTVFFGIDPLLYENLVPFQTRIKDKILNSGAVERNTAVWYRKSKSILGYARDVIKNPEKLPFKSRALHPKLRPYHYYKLRSNCNNLDYVVHGVNTQDILSESNLYSHMLSKYRAAIAATTYYPTIKYWEIAASGCLTFMEITDTNHGDYLGFQDKKNCIVINEKNYKKRFEEYLADPDNLMWMEIAKAGQAHAMQNFNNDKASNDLVSLIREFL